MNKIRELAQQAAEEVVCEEFDEFMITETDDGATLKVPAIFIERLSALLIEECRDVITEVYRATPLELCGPLLTADEEILKHFYGVEE